MPLILFVKHENMLIVFNMPLCEYGNELLTDITYMKHVGSRDEDIAKDRVKAKGNEHNFPL